MKTYQTGNIRNVVLLGSSKSGKTTLSEAMMYEGKVIDRRGTVEAKNTISDNTEIEQINQRSIYSTPLYTEFMDNKLNIMDTPGADDFIGGVISSFKVCDSGILVVNAQQGVEVGTEIFARYADTYKMPVVVAVNQLDAEKASWENTIDSLREAFGNKVVLVQFPVAVGAGFNGFIDVLTMKMYTFTDDNGTRVEADIPDQFKAQADEVLAALTEMAAESDEALMEKYFDAGELSREEIEKGLNLGFLQGSIMPTFCISARKDIGVKKLMEFMINVAPSPAQDSEPTKDGKSVPCSADAIKAVDEKDEEKLGELLNKAAAEDPTYIVQYAKELKQTILSGQGEQHINILKWQLNNINKMEVEFMAPRISYRETITKVAAANYRHKKQSGGAGQFGEVHLLLEPYVEGAPQNNRFKVDGKEMVLNIKSKEEYTMDWGGKLEFYNCIVGGAIDARFMPAILKGIMEKMEEGPLTGSYARDIRVYVYDGKMHPVDSNEISFKLAARNAFKEAFRNAGPKIMEPICNIEIMVPGEYMGDVMSDLQGRRAMIEGMSSVKGFEVLKARVPLAELYKYSTTLSSLTSGRASFTMEMAEYQQVPADVQEKLLKAYQEEEKDE